MESFLVRSNSLWRKQTFNYIIVSDPLSVFVWQWNMFKVKHQGHPDRNHKVWNIVSTEICILYMSVLLECCYIWIDSSQWENWNHLFCRTVSFLTAPHCQFRGVGQGMKQTYLYLWYPLFQAQWDRCDQRNHQT